MAQASERKRFVAAGTSDWLRSVAFTAGLLGLIGLSIERFDTSLLLTLVGSVAFLVVAFHYAFPGSLFFSVALANLVGVYACVFVLFVESSYARVAAPVLSIGFAAPLVAFFAGALYQRRAIRAVVAAQSLRDERHFGRVLGWLAPVFTVGALNFLIPSEVAGGRVLDAVFLAAMAAISAVVFLASRDVATFLIDTGLLFEEFFDRAVRLIVPAFAFLTFYSLGVIVFAALYSALDHLTHQAHFRVEGVLRELSFSEGLYFSLATISTVGYGDITPASNAARILVATEIVSGLLLLLFGFNEIVGYSRDRRHHAEKDGAHQSRH